MWLGGAAGACGDLPTVRLVFLRESHPKLSWVRWHSLGMDGRKVKTLILTWAISVDLCSFIPLSYRSHFDLLVSL